jgi:hypothetical protein
MGLDRSLLRFLLAAKAVGVDFSKLVTIGRQQFTADVDAGWLRQFLADHRLAGDAGSLLSDPDRYGEAFWSLIGGREIDSLDASSFEKATLLHDMNEPLPQALRERFTAVIDGGAIEHIFNVPQAIKNCMEMVKPGGHYLCVTVANSLLGHGFYQFSPEWAFRVFTAENGFKLRSVLLAEVGIARPRFYRVDDPRLVGGRVELATSLPIYMFILAQRTQAITPFRVAPQQSDYVAQWVAGGVGGAPSTESGGAGANSASGKARRLPAFLKWDSPLRNGLRQARNTTVRTVTRTIPGLWKSGSQWVRRRIRSVVVTNPQGLAAPYFHRLTDDDLMHGRITGP